VYLGMNLTVVALMSMAICLFAMPIAQKLNIVDYPDGDRKGHAQPTPMVGGIAIIVPLILASGARILSTDGSPSRLLIACIVCGGATAVVGFIDDQRTVSPSARLVLLAILAFAAFAIDPALVGDHILTASGAQHEIPRWLFAGLVAIAFVGFPSAVNMADGVDGVVVALFFIWTMCIGHVSTDGIAATAHVIAAASAVTLLFNMRGRLFLGDSGAFGVAFVIGILAVAAHNAGALPVDSAIVFFFIPIVDCLRLMFLRAIDGKSPLRPDMNHFHHRLTRAFGARNAQLIYVGVVGASSALVTFVPATAMACTAAVALLYLVLLQSERFAIRPSRRASGRLGTQSAKHDAPAIAAESGQVPLLPPTHGSDTTRTLQ
jgi:UDP-GlcNAc:undecaprenyl-phosphate/decaprenyl-phosphate GlcNAc-1-phosphate transferase